MQILEKDPLSLLTPYRFDVLAKYIYAKHRHLDSSFPKDIYKHHLEVWNNCNEITNPHKSTFEDFVAQFHSIIDSITSQGFDNTLSQVPLFKGHLINGAHRVAASVLNNSKVWCREAAETEGQLDCSYYYLANKKDFQKEGLQSFYADAMALEYAKLKKNTFTITLFPSAQGHLNKVRELIVGAADIVYEKEVDLTRDGAFNFIKVLYEGEPWLGDATNNFHGVDPKLQPCYKSGGVTRIFLIETSDPNKLGALKEEIRNIFKIGKHSVHINDTHEETLRISQALLNDNSIHFLNNCKKQYFPYFDYLLALLKNTIIGHGLNTEDFCVTASSILSAYGLRQGQDLDYLHASEDHKFEGHEHVSSHNSEISHYRHTKDDIIHNPKNHFYFRGLKFASLHVLQQLKQKRGEPKDIVDSDLISTTI
mgnify:CR=1 FL=1